MIPSRAGHTRGVTLSELLVVVAIMGIISAMFYVRSSGYRAKAQTAGGVTIIDQIRTAITAYESNTGSYAGLGCSTSSTGAAWGTSSGFYAAVATALAPYATLPSAAEVRAAFGDTGGSATLRWRACQLDLSGSWAYVIGVSTDLTNPATGPWMVGTQAGVYVCPGPWPPTDPALCTRP